LTTVPSMNTMLDASIVAASIHAPPTDARRRGGRGANDSRIARRMGDIVMMA